MFTGFVPIVGKKCQILSIRLRRQELYLLNLCKPRPSLDILPVKLPLEAVQVESAVAIKV
ncbi:hypothetical protein OGM63_19660 [Plectonema radiosum NIES-515]|uniref:Uncharacterized protein n=1 Tax=Plectonema radiosum NIES-515 TaxID=2986073 RepID=A0ABT3B2U7_9CYAN|nr:hypothetical protein [Plectonema radiosum]MCV3215701.1 hypothetical protein [Plectonema radiosum NIES-515]